MPESVQLNTENKGTNDRKEAYERSSSFYTEQVNSILSSLHANTLQPSQSKTHFKADIELNGPRAVSFFFKIISVDCVDCITGVVELDFIIYQRWVDPCMINTGQDYLTS